MIRPLIVLRPEPGLNETIALAQSLGLQTIAAPLFRIEPVPWTAPDPRDFDAIVAGSVNAFGHGGKALADLTALPAHAVGERTARAAREAGFAVAGIGEGNLQSLVDGLRRPARLLRLAGERYVAIDVPTGVTMEERVVYRAAPLALGQEATTAMLSGAVVLLHSGEAARHFAAECRRLGIERAKVALAVLAPRIGEAAGVGWQSIVTSPSPTDAALLVIAKDMCQTVPKQG